MRRNVLIIEDEVFISEYLKMILEGLGCTVCAVCATLNQYLGLESTVSTDLAFVDISLNGVEDGIKIAELLKGKNIPFAFVTSFSDKDTLMSAILQKPLGYIVKPFEKEDIIKVIENADSVLSNQYLEIVKAHSIHRIAHREITYLKSDNVYVEIHTTGKKVVVREKLSALMELLPSTNFIRVNQSCCVNINFVTEVLSNEANVQNSNIPISRKYRPGFFEIFNKRT